MLTDAQIENIKIARLEPGDLLVLKCRQVVPMQGKKSLKEQVDRFLPEGVKAVLLDGGMDVEVLRRSEAAELAHCDGHNL